jgi:hypothetical protein
MDQKTQPYSCFSDSLLLLFEDRKFKNDEEIEHRWTDRVNELNRAYFLDFHEIGIASIGDSVPIFRFK